MKYPTCLVVFLGHIILLSAHLSAEDLSFERVGKPNAVPVSGISTIFEDTVGHIWLGGQNDLFRVSGNDVDRFAPDGVTTGALPPAQIYQAASGNDGDLLLAQDGALTVYHPSTGQFETSSAALNDQPPPRVVSLLSGSEGEVWLNTSAGILVGPTSGPFVLQRTWQAPFSNYLSGDGPSLQVDGRLFFGGGDGLVEVDAVHHRTELRFADSEVRSLAADGNTGLWVGTVSQGLLHYSLAGNVVTRIDLGPQARGSDLSTNVSQVASGAHQTLWLASDANGLYRFDLESHQLTNYRHDASKPDSLPDNWVGALLEDTYGTLWVSTLQGVAVARVTGSPFASWMEGHTVLGFLERPDGSVLIGAENGLWRWDRRSNRPPMPFVATPVGPLRDLTEMAEWKGDLWLGTGGDGLYQWNPTRNTARHFAQGSAGNDLPSNVVASLAVANGSLWAGLVGGGLVRWDDAHTSWVRPRLDQAQGLANDDVWKIVSSGDGQLWVGTGGSGLYRLNPTSGEVYHVPGSPGKLGLLPHPWVTDLLAAENGQVLVGMGYSGLAIVAPGRGVIQTVGERDGLSNGQIMGLFRDQGGTAWAMTNYGLNRLGSNGQVARFFAKDGLPSNEGMGTSSVLLLSDGTVLVGTTNGYFSFRPQEALSQARSTKVSLRRIVDTSDQVLAPNGYAVARVSVGWSSNGLVAQFAPTGWVAGGETHFQYRLAGLETDWQDAGSGTQARYSRLPGGTYTLQVRATDSQGVWSGPKDWAQLPVEVETPPYATWWAWGLYIVLALGVLFLIFWSLRTRQERRVRTAEEALAKERKVTTRLEELDKLKDAFLANTSHELRTPLHGIVGLAEGLREGSAGPLQPEADSKLAMIVASGRRLSNLVNDILDFSKLKDHELTLRLQPTLLAPVVEFVCAVLASQVSAKNLTFVQDMNPNLPAVLADPDRLQQILFNLLGNAVKFTHQGSVTVRASTDGDFVVLSIEDTGIGMSDAVMARLFQSFEQGDVAIEREYGGTGVGLSITKQLVELHGGVIGVQSRPGTGSIFTVRLPKTNEIVIPSEVALTPLSPTAPEPNTEVEVAPSGSGARILVVDDDPVNVQVLADWLRLRDYVVETASDGPQALAAIARQRPDLVLLDIMMPRMSGYEVCRQLRQTYSSAEVPVVLVTARTQVSDLVEGLGIGANDYITKPWNSGELQARVRTHLELAGINQSYGRFVPREIFTLLNRDSILDVRLGDNVRKEMSIFFCDIRGFTTLSESLSPHELFALVNEYLGLVVPVIRRNHGIVDKFIGDAVMALFPESPAHAVRAALDVQDTIRNWKANFSIGVGIHVGQVVLGTVGEQGRLQGTVLSDAVNLASRLEGLTKAFGAEIVLSEEVRSHAARDDESLRFRPLGLVAVKGRTEPTRLYEAFPMGDPRELGIMAVEEGLQLYHNREFVQAQARFSALAATPAGGPSAQALLRRTTELVLHPPGPDWNGVEYREQK